MSKDDLNQMQKHIIFNAIMSIDLKKFDEDNMRHSWLVKNKKILYALDDTYKNIKDQIIIDRLRFDLGETVSLYDTQRFEEKTREIYPQKI